jgi:hypothetical protein
VQRLPRDAARHSGVPQQNRVIHVGGRLGSIRQPENVDGLAHFVLQAIKNPTARIKE